MDSINMCYEMCDYIEQNGIVKLAGNTRLRDNLKKEFLHFLIYGSWIGVTTASAAVRMGM